MESFLPPTENPPQEAAPPGFFGRIRAFTNRFYLRGQARRVVVVFLIVAVCGIGTIFYVNVREDSEPAPEASVVVTEERETTRVLGTSVEGREIMEYVYGSGDTHLAFVGGIHGGYEWNSVLLSYTLMDYLDANPNVIPKNLTVHVIPSMNPDGVYKVIGKEGRFTLNDVPKGDAAPGRFNAHEVDLNRNFDCRWKPEGVWRGKSVSAGSAPFSEPEAQAIRKFVSETKPRAVIFWHSQANAVYASECTAGILPGTTAIMNAYSRASGYPAVQSFDAYEVTGDAEGWLASIGIPALSVELKTHETVEWEMNKKGIEAIFKYFGSE